MLASPQEESRACKRHLPTRFPAPKSLGTPGCSQRRFPYFQEARVLILSSFSARPGEATPFPLFVGTIGPTLHKRMRRSGLCCSMLTLALPRECGLRLSCASRSFLLGPNASRTSMGGLGLIFGRRRRRRRRLGPQAAEGHLERADLREDADQVRQDEEVDGEEQGRPQEDGQQQVPARQAPRLRRRA